MANVKYYRSTMTNAPSLSGSTQKLIDLLDACLVNGFNSQTVTITRSGAVATVTATGHGFDARACVLIAGSDQTEYNGEHYITIVDDNTFSFTVDGSPATPATGTITAKVAPAGWTKPYTGSNLAAFRAAGGNQMYLRVDDSQNQYGSVAGYASMTGITTGNDRFPATSVYWWKSNAASSTTRPWILIANDRTLHLWVSGNSATDGLYSDQYSFGDLAPTMTGDQFATFISGDTGSSTAFSAFVGVKGALPAYASDGHYLCRDYTYVSGAKTMAKFGDAGKANTPISSGLYYLGNSGLTYPNPTDGGLYLSRLWAARPSHMRGTIPGLWAPLHAAPLSCYDTFTGSGDLAGRTFMAVSIGYTSRYGQIFLEISNTWDVV